MHATQYRQSLQLLKSTVWAAQSVRRTLDVQTRKLHLPMVDWTPCSLPCCWQWNIVPCFQGCIANNNRNSNFLHPHTSYCTALWPLLLWWHACDEWSSFRHLCTQALGRSKEADQLKTVSLYTGSHGSPLSPHPHTPPAHSQPRRWKALAIL